MGRTALDTVAGERPSSWAISLRAIGPRVSTATKPLVAVGSTGNAGRVTPTIMRAISFVRQETNWSRLRSVRVAPPPPTAIGHQLSPGRAAPTAVGDQLRVGAAGTRVSGCRLAFRDASGRQSRR